jgi:hypothetical protein
VLLLVFEGIKYRRRERDEDELQMVSLEQVGDQDDGGLDGLVLREGFLGGG